MTRTAYATRTKLTLQEVADRQGVSKRTVSAWIRQGELRAIDLSSRRGMAKPRLYVDLADLEAFDLRRAVQPEQPVRRRRRSSGSAIEFFK